MRRDAKEFLNAADEDLSSAKELFKTGGYRTAAFHAQQAVEKYLKSYLLEKTKTYPFTHSISELIELCIEIDENFEYLFEINVHTL